MIVAQNEVLADFITRSYNQFTYTNDPWLPLIPRIPIQEGRIPVNVEIPQQGDVRNVVRPGTVSPAFDTSNINSLRDVGSDFTVTDRQRATPDKIADSSITIPIREYSTARYLAPDEDPREASSVYPKIPLQLSNIASELSYHINSTLLWEMVQGIGSNDEVQSDNGAGTGARAYNFDMNRDRIIGTTAYGPQQAPTLANMREAIRRCRSGIIGGVRPDIDDVYCIMSEGMFRGLADSNVTTFFDTSMTGRESTLWTVDHVSNIFGVRIILRNGVLRRTGVGAFLHPITGGAGVAANRDCALLFRRGALLQYVSRPVTFRDVNTPEFLGSTYRWKLNYAAGPTTRVTNLTRGVVALYSGGIV